MSDILVSDVLIGISSNEQARELLLEAVRQLSDSNDICCLSNWYLNNAAYLPPDKTPKYINGVLLISTSLGLPDLTALLKKIELDAGGQRAGGVCPLDLDIVAFEGVSLDVEQRTLPRSLKAEEAYLWTCVQELCLQFQSSLPVPDVWQRQAWPEFTHWQVSSQKVSESVARLLCVHQS